MVITNLIRLNKFMVRFSSVCFVFFLTACSAVNKDRDAPASEPPYVDPYSIKFPNHTFSNQELLDSIAGFKELDVFMASEKCNLVKGYYVLRNKNTNKKVISEFADYLAMQLYDRIKFKLTEGCTYPAMSMVYIYMNEKDYKNKNLLATSSITPKYLSGNAYVDSYILNKYGK